jgi:protein transport protein SEC61 subunit gamma-like protein
MDEQQKPEEPQAPAEQPIPDSAESGQPTSRSALPQEPAPPLQPEVPKKVQQEPQQIAQSTVPPPTQVYVPKATAAAEAKPSKWQKVKDFLVECRRVLRVTKKPDRAEFKTIVKISGIGMAVIGFIGFFVHFIKKLIF